MSLVDDNLADWRVPRWRERDLKGLAQFFNNYKIPLLGFGTTDKNKQLYLQQMAEINEFVSPCLEDLMYDKKEEKYKKKKETEELSRKIIKEILSDLKKNLVSESKIEKVRDNLMDIYNDEAFKSLEDIELRAYMGHEKKIADTIVKLNEEKFDGLDRYSEQI
jgi:uncharacterized protein YpuA (DUF1002 family)